MKKIPLIGKILSTLFAFIEVPLLEFCRRIDKKFNIKSFQVLNSYVLRGRWGGRIIPLNKNFEPDTRFLPTQEIIKLVKNSNITGVSWCYCRSVQRKYDNPHCDHPLNTCIHLGFGHSLYEIPNKSKNLHETSKNEVIELIEECNERGLIHQIIFFPSPQFYYVICNCCPCCCVVLKNFLEYSHPQVIKSDFIAKTDESLCSHCGECQDWCYFGARIKMDTKMKFIASKCFGCGICVSKCPKEAIILKKA